MARNRSSKPRPPKVPRPPGELRQELQQQVDFLSRSCRSFDADYPQEFTQLALRIRVLVHDTRSSTSVLTHVGARAGLTVATQCPKFNLTGPAGQTKIPNGDGPLALKALREEAYCWYPHAWMTPAVPVCRRPPLAEWWEEPAGWTATGETYSRKSIVLAAANQDGGAHVDSEVDEAYFDITRANACRWWVQTAEQIAMEEHDGGDPLGTPMMSPVPVWVRQIAHDLLLTFEHWRGRLGLEVVDVPPPVSPAYIPSWAIPGGPGSALVSVVETSG